MVLLFTKGERVHRMIVVSQIYDVKFQQRSLKTSQSQKEKEERRREGKEERMASLF